MTFPDNWPQLCPPDDAQDAQGVFNWANQAAPADAATVQLNQGLVQTIAYFDQLLSGAPAANAPCEIAAQPI